MTPSSVPNIPNILQLPVPNQENLLKRKYDYRQYVLHNDDARNGEQLVDIREYDIAGQSYYSRPNAATIQAVKGVNPAVRVRKSMAEQLAAINEALQQSAVLTELFGGRVELYANEGLRSQSVQQLLYEDVFPALVRSQFPDDSDKEVNARRDNMIAKPTLSLASPSPHSTGAAVDITMRYTQQGKQFAPGTDVDLGHADADIGEAARPDYFENMALLSQKDLIARRNRRIFYWIMSGALCKTTYPLVVNPTEWWHWSYGDQMWASLTQAPFAFYGGVS